MRWGQFIILISLLVLLHLFLLKNGETMLHLPFRYWLLIFIFPLTAFLYYNTGLLPTKYNLRKIGWLKPFIIGFAWAGAVTIYPVLFHSIINKQQYHPGLPGSLLFLKNFLFITLLCVMFDVKDYAADYMAKVKTFVVRIGLRKTIFYILFPISFSGLCVFIYYAIDHHFHAGKLLLNIIPFVLLMAISFSLCRRRPLLYYLCIVDGLMIVKAVCGSLAMLFF
jgi:4-hydroxybenzoate polyprenyltransferase